jgi:cyanophycin synthetase
VAPGYDRVYIREDKDLRGRKPGEVAGILARTIREENPSVAVEIVLDELEATKAAVCSMIPGEVVVTSSDEVTAVIDWMLENGGSPASAAQVEALTRREDAITTAA